MAVTVHLAYLCSGRLETWCWRRGVLTPGPVFSQEQGGVDAFADHMLELGRPPLHLLADLVEEDFHRVLLPHARGRAGRNLLARRLHQHYRETPYRRAVIQGRQGGAEGAEGAGSGARGDSRGDTGRDTRGDTRRDNIVLMSALTNPLLVQPWTEALALVQAPLAGIWSAAQLCAGLPQALGYTQRHVLLVTFQRCGMRQSYFQDGQLKFSRLVPVVAARAAECASEAARTRQFLISAHLLQRGEMLHTVVLAQDSDIAALSQLCASGPESTFHFVPLALALERYGVRQQDQQDSRAEGGLADGLLLHLLAEVRPRSHYPAGEDGRYYRLWQARVGLYASSMALAACALLWTGANLWAYAEANVAAGTLVEEARHFTARYRSAMAPMPPAPAPTADMRAAVLVDRLLAGQGPAPMDLLAVVSAALDRAPQVQLVSLDWQVTPPAVGSAGAGSGLATGIGSGSAGGSGEAAANGATGNAPGGSMAGAGYAAGNSRSGGAVSAMPAALTGSGAGAGDASADAVPSALLGIPVKPRQSLRLEAEVRLAQSDARGAVDSMNGFAQDLARDRRLTVAIEKPVLDIRPDVKLSGRTAADAPPPAPFTLRLEYTP